MKLTLQTELGGFDFQLSQTSVIYLLNLERQLEDEGDPKKDININIDNINAKDKTSVFRAIKPGNVIEPVKGTLLYPLGSSCQFLVQTE